MPPRYWSMSEQWMCWRKLVPPISSTPKFRDKWTERGVRARPVPLSNHSSTRSPSNNGELRPLRRKAGDPMPGHGHQIVTPEAAFLTLEMLNVPRPEINYADSGNVAPVFWKTGTSHGFHDAWSIAVFNHYVLAVWIGNFDGKPNPAFIGRSAAAPLLFQITDSLRPRCPHRSEPHLPPPAPHFNQLEFCAVRAD